MHLASFLSKQETEVVKDLEPLHGFTIPITQHNIGYGFSHLHEATITAANMEDVSSSCMPWSTAVQLCSS